MIDTGLANTVSFRFSEDKGRMLETLVYRHLKRKGYDVYFHRGKKECDFIIKEGMDITHAIQVSCSLSDPKTREREILGLVDAMRACQSENNIILTLDESETIEVDIEKNHIQFLLCLFGSGCLASFCKLFAFAPTVYNVC